jgi:hypothetical protein
MRKRYIFLKTRGDKILKKRIAIVSGVIVLILGAFLIYNQIKYTTYGEAVSGMLKEDEQVNQIEILWTTRDSNQGYIRKRVTIKDEETINKILDQPSDMKLKVNNKTPGTEYWITFYTDTNVYGIVFGDGDAQIGDGFFNIVDENILEQVIKSEELNWKNKE